MHWAKREYGEVRGEDKGNGKSEIGGYIEADGEGEGKGKGEVQVSPSIARESATEDRVAHRRMVLDVPPVLLEVTDDLVR